MTTTGHRKPADLPLYALAPFVIGTFAITWGIAGAYILWPEAAAARLGALSGLHPLYFLATWAPAIMAFALVLAHGGWRGLWRFLGRVAAWRVRPVWWLLILAGIPLIYMAGSLFKGGPLLAPLPDGGIAPALTYLGIMAFLGPVEEFGWRGVAQPLLQRRLAPFWTGAVIGATWGLWHLPAFYLSGTVYADWHFLPFFIGNVTLAILVVPILNDGRGGLLLPMLFHWQLINPFWPDAQPLDTWLFVGLTALVTFWQRDRMFTRDPSVTTVIPGST